MSFETAAHLSFQGKYSILTTWQGRPANQSALASLMIVPVNARRRSRRCMERQETALLVPAAACWPVSLHCPPSGWMDGWTCLLVCLRPTKLQCPLSCIHTGIHFQQIYVFLLAEKCHCDHGNSFPFLSPIMRGNKRSWDCFEQSAAGWAHFGNVSSL